MLNNGILSFLLDLNNHFNILQVLANLHALYFVKQKYGDVLLQGLVLSHCTALHFTNLMHNTPQRWKLCRKEGSTNIRWCKEERAGGKEGIQVFVFITSMHKL